MDLSGTEINPYSGVVWCQKHRSREENGILQPFKGAGPLSHIASYRREVTRWHNGSYKSVNHQQTADVQLYLSFLPHIACAFASCSEGNAPRGFMLVPITGRSQADTGRVKCQEHLVDVKA